MITPHSISVIAESRRHALLEEANQEHLAKIARSGNVKLNYIVLVMNMFRYITKRNAASKPQASPIRHMVQRAANR